MPEKSKNLTDFLPLSYKKGAKRSRKSKISDFYKKPYLMPAALEEILAYHQVSKHNFNTYAPGPRSPDPATRPDPFLRYHGSRLIKLDRERPENLSGKAEKAEKIFPNPAYEEVFRPGEIPPAPLNRKSVSRLFFDSLAISAWKKADGVKWALRVNPSSGNLHPTESYLLSGPVEGLFERAAVCHYSPLDHSLEVRARFSRGTWEALRQGFPESTVFLGLSSIHWRTAWKYGVRAFRYSLLDVGHAAGALAFAAAGLGWQARLLTDMGSDELALLLGLSGRMGPEKEVPACLLACFPAGEECNRGRVTPDSVSAFRALAWQGRPSRLSPGHEEWLDIEKASLACRKEKTGYSEKLSFPERKTRLPPPAARKTGAVPFSLRQVIHQRRSALEMNNSAYMGAGAFYGILERSLPEAGKSSGREGGSGIPADFSPGRGLPPFSALPFRPFVHLLLFVNRVKGLDSGLYIFLRDPGIKEKLKASMREGFLWEKPGNCPSHLEFYKLLERDLAYFAARLSCGQKKAADACFTACMLPEFENPLETFGPWFYPYLHLECGCLGQLLYLEAEARGFRGCGIGCFFDDPVHEMLGFEGSGSLEFQDLYHFSVGAPFPEKGVKTLPAYE